jgi:AraC-like DNA-binding protein
MAGVDLALRAGGAVLLALIGVLLAWRYRAALAGWLAGFLALAVAAHLLCPPLVQAWGLRWASLPILLACIAVPGAFWLFACALFQDGFRLRTWLVRISSSYMLAVVAVELDLRGAAAPRDRARPDVPSRGPDHASLATQLGAQEYRLRRVINRHLGFRNFNDFLDHHRVRDARIVLADPDHARVPILTLALDLGYASLSPFNRAFKAQTGLMPSEYRRTKRSNPVSG